MVDEHQQRPVRLNARLFDRAAAQAARQGRSIDEFVDRVVRLHIQDEGVKPGADNRAERSQEKSASYFAFISYSHDDRKIAAELHRRLEGFRVPRALPGRPTGDGKIVRRIRPVFRDQDEFSASADLGRSIREALRAARTLVVVCSPRSAASAWVGEEIRYFKQLGRAAQIYCLIIDGSPGVTNRGDGARAALHPALLEHFDENGEELEGEAPEPLAIDIRESGLGTAVVKIAAGILNVGYEALHQRVRKQKRRQVTVVSLMFVTVAAVVTWLTLDGLTQKQRNLAQELAVIAQQQLYDDDPVAGMALMLHAVAISPGHNDRLLEGARNLLPRGNIAALGKDIERVVSSADGAALVLDRADDIGEVRSGIDGSLHYTLPRELRRARYYAEDDGYFLLEYELFDAELRHAETGAVLADLKAPVSNLSFGPQHVFAQSSGAYPNELLRLSDGGAVSFASGARPDSVAFATPASDLMVVNFLTGHEPQLRRMSDDFVIALERQPLKIELSPDPDTSRLLISYADGFIELLRSADLSLIRRFDQDTATAGFWSRGARLFSAQRKDGQRELIDMADGSSLATGQRVRRSRDPDRSYAAVLSGQETSWYSAAEATKLAGIVGHFSDARFSQDSPPGRIALRNADGWQLHRTADGSLVAKLPGAAKVSLDKRYLVTSGETQGQVRQLADGSLALTLDQPSAKVTFVSRDLALVQAEGGSPRFYRLPSGARARVPASRNIEFDAPVGPDKIFHMIRYTDGRTELRAGGAGPTVAWIEGKIAQPSHLVFLPQSAPSHVLVKAPDVPSEIYPLIRSTEQPAPGDGDSRITLPATVNQVDLLPGDNPVFMLLRYTNGNTELWSGPDEVRRLARLGTNLEDFLYFDAQDRLVLRYADGTADLVDLNWLRIASAPGITDEDLFEQACLGPLRTLDPAVLEPYLQGDNWMGCRGSR